MATQLKVEEFHPDEGPEDTTPDERDFEAEARSHGWSPKDDFKGDPSRWVDAETFVKRADEVMPLLKSQNKHLKGELDQLKKQFKQFSRHASAAEQRIRAELEAQIDDATEAGDKQRVRSLREQEKQLDAEQKDPRSTQEEAREAFDNWREEHVWYDRGGLANASEMDISARLYADRMVEKHIDRTKDMPPGEFFGMIAGLVKEKYPQLGQRQARAKPASDVAGPGSGGRAPRGTRTWDALPPEARQRFDKWISNKVIDMGSTEKSRDYCIKTFDWDGWNKEASR
jgi:hypothetical protein